ncbi:MAG: hypothetical protein WBZ36_03530, partial [Candidatus Nitrosopolaris sp.]
MTETNIMIAQTRKIKHTEFRNLSTIAVENCDDVRKELENNCSVVCMYACKLQAFQYIMIHELGSSLFISKHATLLCKFS